MARNYNNPTAGLAVPPSFGALPLLDDDLTESNLTSDVFQRPGGLYELGVIVNVSAFSATTSSFILQGSADGTNYHQVATITVTATGTYSFGDQGLPVPRFRYFRVQATVSGGAATFTADVVVNGIYQGTGFSLFNETLTVAGAAVNGTTQSRPAGALLATVQAVVNRTAGTLSLLLQGSTDGTNWITLATEAGINLTTSVVFDEGGDDNVSLGGFTYFRVRGTTSDFTGSVVVYWAFDSNDANRVDSVVDTNGINTNTAFLKVAMTAAAEVADERRITFTFTNFDGSALGTAINFLAVVSDTSLAGEVDLASNAVWDVAAVTGILRAGGGSNRIVGTTDATGVFVIDLQDAANETVYVSVLSGQVANTIPVIIAQNPELSVAFA